jgi:dynactin-5
MPPRPSVRGEYIETETGNKISRRASVLGPRHIILAGKCVIQQDVVIHGDLVRPPQPKPPPTQTDPKSTTTTASSTTQDQTSIHLGRYVFISPGCTLHPPSRLTTIPNSNGGNPQQVMTYFMLRISDYVYIGPNTHVRAAEIRSNVWIGANCTIGNMVMIKDNVKILDGTVLPANTIWAGGTVIAGRPGRVIGEIGEGWAAGSSGSGGGGGGSTVDEGVGVKSRERWAAVGNKR